MPRLIAFAAVLFLASGAALLGAGAGRLLYTAVLAQSNAGDYKLPFGSNPFAPSNARSATATFITENQFIPASRCAGCHQTIHNEWNESAHRNSFREPFYQANVKLLIKQRGLEVTRHCESCHNPVALFSGALTADSKLSRPFDDEGVSCSICHSVEQTTTQGIGSYTLASPALLVRSNGERVREATDDQIKTDLPSHYRAVMRPLLRTPEFCAACHKAAVVPELNGRKWLRSFAIYDEWQQSAFSTETLQPLSRRERQTCQSCHMPAPKGGKALHRWPGGNTAIPAHYGWPDQSSATENLLKSSVVSVDIFALRKSAESACDVIAPLDGRGTAIEPGEQVTVDVVVANRGVGHSFPAELRDIFEAWLEFQATDATGRILAHSGAVRDDGTLEWDAHAYRTVPISDDGDPVVNHDIWNTRATALDRQLAAGRADLACFKVSVPANARSPITLTAKLNYRRFNSRFMKFVATDTKVGPSPVVEMAGATVALLILQSPRSSTQPRSISASAITSAAARESVRQRWRAYGVALVDQQQYEGAAHAFEEALKFAANGSPEEESSRIDVAMTYLKMERAGSSQSVIERAEKSLARALEIAPGDGRARYYRALLNIKRFRYGDAVSELEALSRQWRERQFMERG